MGFRAVLLVADGAQEGDGGLFVLVEVDLDHRKADQELGVGRLRVDCGRGLPQGVRHAAELLVDGAESAAEGRHVRASSDGCLQQTAAILQSAGIGGDHAEQGNGCRVARNLGQNLVADRRGFVVAPRLSRALGAGQCLFDGFAAGRGSCRRGNRLTAHADFAVRLPGGLVFIATAAWWRDAVIPSH